MTEKQARHLFASTCRKLHEAGWDVVGVISSNQPDGNECSTKVLIHAVDDDDRMSTYQGLVDHLQGLSLFPIPATCTPVGEGGCGPVECNEATCVPKE